MNTEQMNEYCKKLCEDTIVYFLKDSGDKDIPCQMSMRNFILSRRGWVKSDESDDSFVFTGKQSITIDMSCCESTNILINTATSIAKAELADELERDNKRNPEDMNVKKIVECIENQDWVIPFIRKKLFNKNMDVKKKDKIIEIIIFVMFLILGTHFILAETWLLPIKVIVFIVFILILKSAIFSKKE